MMNIVNNVDSLNALIAKAKSGLKKSFLSTFGVLVALVLVLQVTFFNSEAIAAPFGKQVEGVKVDIAIDKAAGTVKEISRDLRDGRTDKVIDKVADTTKEISKETGNRAKELAKNVKDGTKENISKVEGATKNAKNDIGDGVEKAKDAVGDRTGEALDNTKDLSEKSGNKVDEIVDSVKGFLGQ